MKNSGLKNRFSKEVRWEWEEGWYSCMICGKNNWDAIHHIISPSMTPYIKGKHNTSILNSCPIHNFGCHIGKEGYLNRVETIKNLLQKTKEALDFMGYKLNDKDKKFLTIYKDLYEN